MASIAGIDNPLTMKAVAMEKPVVNYESLVRITRAISMIRDPEEIILISVEGVTTP